MKLKLKEKNKIKGRRRLWYIMGWTWAYKKNNGETEYTDNPEDGKGIGYFRKNHSLNCGCGQCKERTRQKRRQKKKDRMKNKKLISEIMKSNKIE